MNEEEKTNIFITIHYKTTDNSAGSSLCANRLWVNLSFTEQLSVSTCIFGISGFFGHSGVLFLKSRSHKCSFVGKQSRNVCFEGRSSWLVLHRDSSQASRNTGKPKQDVLIKKLEFEGIGVNQRCTHVLDTH